MEHKTNTSKIELHELAAKVFPNLLDFMYLDCRFSGSSVPLYHLGQFFEIPSIRSAIRGYWKRTDYLSNVTGYLDHIKIFNCDTARREVAALFLRNPFFLGSRRLERQHV